MDMEELIRIGAHREGTDPEIDAAIRFIKPANQFLGQAKKEATPSPESFAGLYQILGDAGINVDIPKG